LLIYICAGTELVARLNLFIIESLHFKRKFHFVLNFIRSFRP
jgi:hypothetical protein